MTIRGRKAYARVFWSLLPKQLVPWADPCEDPHDTVTVDGVDIDKGIAPLVIYLWSQGISTHDSCQGDCHLYRLYESRHPAESTPAGNPYAAYLAVDSLAAAQAVIRTLNPPPQSAAIMNGGDRWFVEFDPSALLQWRSPAP
ncbi:hypothetical protein H7I77_25360 [Mycolicibacterium novocastrense]|uniref:Uncharacterized protein n=1 Tax=Mycolicibacterium novocastrense TaxID=59813 RepID=A0AAW5SQT3_MYCNV|nr:MULTISPECIES: hypothetical protein [Mycolicibacterium]MCV7026639.1 hypothetical protein [Mycolicibacterium novocastrense]MDX1887511.1 hypothetical protein [Mycolicibacterium sp. 120270]GAT07607.1 uncharacterized protein RMCN_0740 [Mycolicibacterium novocastrense]